MERNNTNKTLNSLSNTINSFVKENVPVRTGSLKNSIGSEIYSLGVNVYGNSYFKYLKDKQPNIDKIVDDYSVKVAEAYFDDFKKELQKKDKNIT
jgi:hypothetical protein